MQHDNRTCLYDYRCYDHQALAMIGNVIDNTLNNLNTLYLEETNQGVIMSYTE